MKPPIALIAGIPLGIYQRARETKEKRRCCGWNVRTFAGQEYDRCDFARIAKRVLDVADGEETSGHDGVHLLIAHEGDRSRFHRDLRDRCYRVVWLPPYLAKQYGRRSFDDLLHGVLQFERSWRKSVRPTIDSPLLLPENQFSAEPSTKDMWSRAFRVCRERDEIQAVKQTIARFRVRHHYQRSWRDVNELLFRRGEPSHGGRGLPSWRWRKFTFQLPAGHHFDVRHARDRPFEMAGADGTSRHRVYANVDAYGYVRGGK